MRLVSEVKAPAPRPAGEETIATAVEMTPAPAPDMIPDAPAPPLETPSTASGAGHALAPGQTVSSVPALSMGSGDPPAIQTIARGGCGMMVRVPTTTARHAPGSSRSTGCTIRARAASAGSSSAPRHTKPPGPMESGGSLCYFTSSISPGFHSSGRALAHSQTMERSDASPATAQGYAPGEHRRLARLVGQQPPLVCQAATVSRQRAVGADDAMAGDDNGNRVRADSPHQPPDSLPRVPVLTRGVRRVVVVPAGIVRTTRQLLRAGTACPRRPRGRASRGRPRAAVSFKEPQEAA